jgi:para-aminobenzoate synthetase component 1
VERHEGDPIAVVAERIEAEQGDFSASAESSIPPGLPFAGGAIGYFGFELARHIESLPASTIDDIGAPDLAIGWYDAALVWDRLDQQGWLTGTPEAVAELSGHLAEANVENASNSRPRDWIGNLNGPTRFESNMEMSRYLAQVEAARRYIAAGDIYQVNLSQRFSAPLAISGFEAYLRLRRISPAPFAAYISAVAGESNSVEVLSSSPERLLLIDENRLETRPIKGTRPRGRNSDEDARLAEELQNSGKDAAEHAMIVDLERNDLGRIAETGSVAVPQFKRLESYSHVHQLTSSVTALGKAGVSLDSTLRAILPGGSISGAPKIRALEIIDELEPTARGIYTGAIGYISAHGRCDLNVAIRTITVAKGCAHCHVGSAIVHDSVAESEYQETLDKARGMARALDALLPDELPPEHGRPPLTKEFRFRSGEFD